MDTGRIREIRQILRRALDLLESEHRPIPLWGQRDPRWKDVPLGYGPTTIGRYGCVVTCLAMIASAAAGTAITPDEANDRLRQAQAFTGEDGNLVIWGRVAKALPLKFEGLYVCRYRPAPIAAINGALEAGHFVLAEVDLVPGGQMNQHWVVLVAPVRGGIDYEIADPWPRPAGGRRLLLDSYGASAGWRAASRAIFRVTYWSADS